MKSIITFLLFLSAILLNGQILNSGFEDVEFIETLSEPVLYPRYWHSESPQWDGYITTDSYSGDYAMYLTSWYQGNNTVVFSNGSQGIWGMGLTARNEFLKGAGTPIQELPTKLIAYYKFEDVKPNDSIIVSTYLKKYLPDTDSIIIVGFGTEKFPAVDEYQKLEVQIEKMSNESPDSIIIQIETSTNVNFCEDFSECNFLTIDEMSLDFTSSLGDHNDEFKLAVKPNPTYDYVNIESEYLIRKITIFNALGVELKTIDVNQDFIGINMSNFSEGLYLLQICSSNDRKITKKVLKINS